jgi:hypothetical protein
VVALTYRAGVLELAGLRSASFLYPMS